MKKTNPWGKINQKPPKFEVGDIVYTYLTHGDKYLNVPAQDLPKTSILFLTKGVVVGYKIEANQWHGEWNDKKKKWLPLYIIKTLEIYFDYANLETVGEEQSVNRWWVEQADDVMKLFGKRPSHMEFVFR